MQVQRTWATGGHNAAQRRKDGAGEQPPTWRRSFLHDNSARWELCPEQQRLFRVIHCKQT